MTYPQFGDVIFAHRPLYNHYGIYVNNARVIHYCKKSNGIIEKIKKTITCDGIIAATSYKDFHDGDPVYICRFNELVMNTLIDHSLLHDFSFWDLLIALLGSIFPISILIRFFKTHNDTYPEEHRAAKKILSPKETVAIAEQCIGKSEYSLWGNNCEHFATWCKTGVKDCVQIKKILEEFAIKADH